MVQSGLQVSKGEVFQVAHCPEAGCGHAGVEVGEWRAEAAAAEWPRARRYQRSQHRASILDKHVHCPMSFFGPKPL